MKLKYIETIKTAYANLMNNLVKVSENRDIITYFGKVGRFPEIWFQVALCNHLQKELQGYRVDFEDKKRDVVIYKNMDSKEPECYIEMKVIRDRIFK